MTVDEHPDSPTKSVHHELPAADVPVTADDDEVQAANEQVPAVEQTKADEVVATEIPPIPIPTTPKKIPIPDETSAFDPITRHAPESPTISLITALRDQISLLTNQSSDLNTKLITSLDRVADLEDEIEHDKTTFEEKERLIAELEAEKAQWEESMNTGLLVERGTVRDEMQRLVEGLVEEERRRGSAEQGRRRVEDEVDDLSATLFEQANTMVAAERLSRVQAETRMRAAEDNLAAAEAAMRDMQLHLQSLPTLLPPPTLSQSPSLPRRYLATHTPYSEFTSFLSHLRSLKPRHSSNIYNFPAPPISSLIAQPFLARSIIEDVDPTLRLDVAPDLSWLSRRNISAAIIAGDLIIEPVGLSTLLATSTYSTATGDIGCSMCGRSIFAPEHRPGKTSATATLQSAVTAAGAGTEMNVGGGRISSPPPVQTVTTTTTRPSSTSRFSFKPFFQSPSSSTTQSTSPSPSPAPSPRLSQTPTHTHTHVHSHAHGSLPPIFIFRVSPSETANAPDKEREVQGRLYPLCASGWCLNRLRAVCEWWRYVRLGLIEPVWKSEDGWTHHPAQTLTPRATTPAAGPGGAATIHQRGVLVKTRSSSGRSDPTTPVNESVELPEESNANAVGDGHPAEPPALPPRRRSGWSLGFMALGGNSSNTGLGLGKTITTTTPPHSPSMATTANESERGIVIIEQETTAELATVQEPGLIVKVQEEKEGTDTPSDSAVASSVASQEDGAIPNQQINDDDEKKTALDEQEVKSGPNSDAEDASSFRTTDAQSAGASPQMPLSELDQTPMTEENGTTEKGIEEVDSGEQEEKVDENGQDETDKLEAETATEDPDAPAAKSDSDATNTVDLASPRTSTDESEKAKDSPPAPKRPARRTVPPTPSGVPSPLVPPRRSMEMPTLKVEDEENVTPRTPDMSSIDEHAPASTPGTVTAATSPHISNAPPALPPRHSRKHSSDDSSSTTGKQADWKYLHDMESWDNKCWKEVIRLKEEMWKAKVGIKDGDQE